MVIKNFLYDRKGMGTVEVVIIVAVLVALALLFKDFIIVLAEDIFDKIETSGNSAINVL